MGYKTVLGLEDFPPVIRKSFEDSLDVDVDGDDARNKVIDNFEKGLIDVSEFFDAIDILEKGKRANIGEIRIWKDGRFQRVIDGWREVNDGSFSNLHRTEEQIQAEQKMSNNEIQKRSSIGNKITKLLRSQPNSIDLEAILKI